jgi:hypothetical protein
MAQGLRSTIRDRAAPWRDYGAAAGTRSISLPAWMAITSCRVLGGFAARGERPTDLPEAENLA